MKIHFIVFRVQFLNVLFMHGSVTIREALAKTLAVWPRGFELLLVTFNYGELRKLGLLGCGGVHIVYKDDPSIDECCGVIEQ